MANVGSGVTAELGFLVLKGFELAFWLNPLTQHSIPRKQQALRSSSRAHPRLEKVTFCSKRMGRREFGGDCLRAAGPSSSGLAVRQAKGRPPKHYPHTHTHLHT